MSDRAAPEYVPPEPVAGYSDRATGFIMFAAFLMVAVGCFQLFQGLVALSDKGFFLAARQYPLRFDVTTWGWIHLIFGILVIVTGIALLTGRGWARILGIVLAILSALANFAFIPHYPIWSTIVIAFDVLVIWALAAYGKSFIELIQS